MSADEVAIDPAANEGNVSPNESEPLWEPPAPGRAEAAGRLSAARAAAYKAAAKGGATSPVLRVADVRLLDKEKCTYEWPYVYMDIIQSYMICSEDIVPNLRFSSPYTCMSSIADCSGGEAAGNAEWEWPRHRRYADIDYKDDFQFRQTEDNDSNGSNDTTKTPKAIKSTKSPFADNNYSEPDPSEAGAPNSTDQDSKVYGGFCENDHGGPLVMQVNLTGKELEERPVNDTSTTRDVVVGIISVFRVPSPEESETSTSTSTDSTESTTVSKEEEEEEDTRFRRAFPDYSYRGDDLGSTNNSNDTEEVEEPQVECRGPFLYSSVLANHELIICILYGDKVPSCRRMLRSGVNNRNWDVFWPPDVD